MLLNALEQAQHAWSRAGLPGGPDRQSSSAPEANHRVAKSLKSVACTDLQHLWASVSPGDQLLCRRLKLVWVKRCLASCAGWALAHRHRHHGVLPGHSRAVHLAGLQDLDILGPMDRPGWPSM